MTDKSAQEHFKQALAGDIIFVERPISAHPVKGYQKLFGKLRPQVVHVAALVTPSEVLETNFGKRAFTLALPEWMTARPRNNDEFFRILRNVNFDLSEKQTKMTAAGSYFLGEKYNIWDVWDENPHGLGYSICSSLTHKLLVRADLIPLSKTETRRNILPGELQQLLIDHGWREVTPDDYFADHVSDYLPLSPIQISEMGRLQRSKMRELHDVLDDIIEFGEQQGISRRNLVETECKLWGKNLLEVLQGAFTLAHAQALYLDETASDETRHWSEEDTAAETRARRLQKNRREVAELAGATFELTEEFYDIVTGSSILARLQDLIDQIEVNSVDVHAIDALISEWKLSEIQFARVAFITSWELAHSSPSLEWAPGKGTQSVDTSSSEAIRSRLQSSYDYLLGMMTRTAGLLKKTAELSVALVGRPQVDEIKAEIARELEALRAPRSP